MKFTERFHWKHLILLGVLLQLCIVIVSNHAYWQTLNEYSL